MPSDRDERIADFVTPFRVEPGSNVSLAKDFNPAFKAGVSSDRQVKGCWHAALVYWPSIKGARRYPTSFTPNTHGVLIQQLAAVHRAGLNTTLEERAGLPATGPACGLRTSHAIYAGARLAGWPSDEWEAPAQGAHRDARPCAKSPRPDPMVHEDIPKETVRPLIGDCRGDACRR
jgi:hypothetical protein